MTKRVQDCIKVIWDSLDIIRGSVKPSSYLQTVVPLVLLRRLECLRNETTPITGGDSSAAKALDELTSSFSGEVQEIFELFEFSKCISQLDHRNVLADILQHFTKLDLTLDSVSNLEMVDLFNELVQRLAESSDDQLAECSTPSDVNRAITRFLFAGKNHLVSTESGKYSIYDPAVGVGGLLNESVGYLRELNSSALVSAFGQDINPLSIAICKATMLLSGQSPRNFLIGNTLTEDQFKSQRFDYLLAAPPMGAGWKSFDSPIRDECLQLSFRGRFGPGLPRVSDSSYLFLLHLISKMKAPDEGGSRMAFIGNGSMLYVGGAGSGESSIREWILGNDLLEAVVALPGGIYNHTGIETFILLLTNRKNEARRGLVQLIDLRNNYELLGNRTGIRRAQLTSLHIDAGLDLYSDLVEGPMSRIVENSEFGFQELTLQLDESGREAKKKRETRQEIVPLGQKYIEEIAADGKSGDNQFTIVPELTKIGYAINFHRIITEPNLYAQLSKLESKNYQKIKLSKLIRKAKIPAADESFVECENALYFPLSLGGKFATSLDDISIKHNNYVQLSLDQSKINSTFAKLFFQSNEGRACLSLLDRGMALQRTTLTDIKSLWIVIPPLEEQEQIVNTEQKINLLRGAIGEFEQELALNISGIGSINAQLDSVLSSLELLSEAEKVYAIIRKGENKTSEFKSTLSLDKKTGKKESYIEMGVLKTIAAFLNSDGGTLLVGVADNGEVLGLNDEIFSFHNDNADKFKLHFKNILSAKIGAEFYPFIEYDLVNVDSRSVLQIEVRASNSPCYIENKDFFVRTNPATDKLEGPKLVNYVRERFHAQ